MVSFAIPFSRDRDPAVRSTLTGSVAKGLGAGIFELRLHFGPGYRVYFGRDGETIVILLGGGTKKRQQTNIGEARALWREYKAQKREE